MIRLIAIMVLSFLIVSGVTVLLIRVFKGNIFVKYIPGVLFLLGAVYNMVLSRTATTGFEDLARLIVAMILFSASMGGLITSLVIDFVLPRIRKD